MFRQHWKIMLNKYCLNVVQCANSFILLCAGQVGTPAKTIQANSNNAKCRKLNYLYAPAWLLGFTTLTRYNINGKKVGGYISIQIDDTLLINAE